MTRSSRIILAAVAAAAALAAGAAVPALLARPAATAQDCHARGRCQHDDLRLPDLRAHPRQSEGQQAARVPGGDGPGAMARAGRAAGPVAEPEGHLTESQPDQHQPEPHSDEPVTLAVTVRDAVHDTRSRPGTAGLYAYPLIPNSNGYTTYVSNNCWADPSASDQHRRDPGNGTVRADEPASNTGVKTYPDVQQLFSDWTGGGWNNGPNVTDTPVSGLTRLSSSYAETMPHNSGTDAQAAWDIWLSGCRASWSTVIMKCDTDSRRAGLAGAGRWLAEARHGPADGTGDGRRAR